MFSSIVPENKIAYCDTKPHWSLIFLIFMFLESMPSN